MDETPSEDGGLSWLPKMDPVVVSVSLLVLACVVAYAFAQENKRLHRYIADGGATGVHVPCRDCAEKVRVAEDLETAYYDGFHGQQTGGAFNGHTDLSHGASASGSPDAGSSDTA